METGIQVDQISDWRSIVTLVVFVITNIIVLFPFHLHIPVPRALWTLFFRALVALRIIRSTREAPQSRRSRDGDSATWWSQIRSAFVRVEFPMDFVTAPLIAVLFLLAILAIGRVEVEQGTVGADNIFPIDIMVFFLTLAYIAISIDASGLLRWLAFKVLQKGGEVGRRLFGYLYFFFFGLATCIGNDPIILSGTAFLAYMYKVSANIKDPRAWIYTQFAMANTASAILVSSNPTNLVLSGAFSIKFITYTANVVVPVVVTVIVLFPFLLHVVFPYDALIPKSIEMHELSEEEKARKPRNPNVPRARGESESEADDPDTKEGQQRLRQEIMNPWLDKWSAAFGAIIMAATLVTLLALNASSASGKERPAFYVTLPAAFVMFCWDMTRGWMDRKETRELARQSRHPHTAVESLGSDREEAKQRQADLQSEVTLAADGDVGKPYSRMATGTTLGAEDSEEKADDGITPVITATAAGSDTPETLHEPAPPTEAEEKRHNSDEPPPARGANQGPHGKATLSTLIADAYRWCQETFPTTTAVMAHLPLKLVPFALCMFVLVQALVTKGWVQVLAVGWDRWVNKTGTVGAVGGMAFLSVILCNFSGTNIGTTILLSRVVQAWVSIHEGNHIPISERTFWATVYSMAISVNYGAFSTVFSASLAGLLWKDILARKHIVVRSVDFARINLPIIAVAMVVGCTVLVGEVYIVRKDTPYVG